MRKESEKKNRLTSVRMTEDQYSLIEKQAKEKCMSISAYMIEAAVHSGNTSPRQLVCMQNLVNQAYEIIKSEDPKLAEQMKEEAAEIWSM